MKSKEELANEKYPHPTFKEDCESIDNYKLSEIRLIEKLAFIAGHQARDGEVEKLVEALKISLEFIEELAKNHGITKWSGLGQVREALKPYQ